MAENQYVLTQEGKESLLKRLDILLEEKTQALAELNFARSQGDLSENSDYDAAREKVEKIKGEIEAINYQLDHAKIVDTAEIDSDVASVTGGEVTIRRLDNGEEFKFHIVGLGEADPLHGKITNMSPIASAIIGHKAGDICHVHAKIEYDIQIVEVKAK